MHLVSIEQPHLLVFVPGERLSSQDKPVVLGSSLHDADVDGEPASADHLHTRVQQLTQLHTSQEGGHVSTASKYNARKANKREIHRHVADDWLQQSCKYNSDLHKGRAHRGGSTHTA